MLTAEDIKNLTDYQKEAFKDTFATKNDMADVKAQLNVLTMAVDGFAKEMRGWREEKAATDHRLDTHDQWFKILADKVGVKLPS